MKNGEFSYFPVFIVLFLIFDRDDGDETEERSNCLFFRFEKTVAKNFVRFFTGGEREIMGRIQKKGRVIGKGNGRFFGKTFVGQRDKVGR